MRHGARRHHHGLGHSWLAFAQVAAVLIGIWALTGAGYFWPVWVLAWWGFALVMRTAPGLLRTR